MTTRIKKAILAVLVVGQLGLVGCATPQVRMAAATPSSSLTTSTGFQTPIGRTLPWAPAQSRLEPVSMGNGWGNISDGEMVVLMTILGLAIVTWPVWGPIRWLVTFNDRY